MVKLENKYPLVIIGMGPAGYSASIYASRYNVKHILIGAQMGGQMGEAHIIENYPGIPHITGAELTQKMREHALKFGAVEVFDKVVKLSKDGENFVIKTAQDKEYLSTAVILALGTSKRHLNVPGEKEFYGKGVTYCATCDGPFYRDKVVAVIGGGDAANTASLYLAEIAKQVYQIVINDHLDGEEIWQQKVLNNPKIKVIFNTTVKEFNGDQRLKSIKLTNGQELDVDGAFIEIGSMPDVNIGDISLEVDDFGFVKVKADQSTNIPGIFAAGDLTTGSNKFRQIATAISEGAIAAASATRYLRQKSAV